MIMKLPTFMRQARMYRYWQASETELMAVPGCRLDIMAITRSVARGDGSER